MPTKAPHPNESVLSVRKLSLSVPGGLAVRGLDLDVPKAQTMALIGESGCGKSLTAQAILRLLPSGVGWAGGQVCLEGEPLAGLTEAQMRRIRGKRIGMIFQEPSLCLNPVLRIATQLKEVLALHHGLHGLAAQKRMQALLEQVGVDQPLKRLSAYPFELSGGLKQRMMMALALAGEPAWLIADEPTTALDVSVQAQVLQQLRWLQNTRQMGLLLVTHDLGVVASLAHQVGVMYAGELVESAPAHAFFHHPAHPYTRALFAALPGQHTGASLSLPGRVLRPDETVAGCRFAPRCGEARPVCHSTPPPWVATESGHVRCHAWLPSGAFALAPWANRAPLAADDAPCEALAVLPVSPAVSPLSLPASLQPVLDVEGLCVHFPLRSGFFRRVRGVFRAVDEVDLRLYPGQTLALVGESGSGKSTLARALLHLLPHHAKAFRVQGQPPDLESRQGRAAFRRCVQLVFQDPHASLNGRLDVQTLLSEGMHALGIETNEAAQRQRVAALLEQVGLEADMAMRYPHQFSGGQRQRLAIARALAVQPRLLVCDEPTSALDVSVQAQILGLLRDLQKRHALSYLLITHNMAVVREMADQMAVLYRGKIVEEGPAKMLLHAPQHPYTQHLLSCIPSIFPTHANAVASPNALALPPEETHETGCAFALRCPKTRPVCRTHPPPWVAFDAHWRVRCHDTTASAAYTGCTERV